MAYIDGVPLANRPSKSIQQQALRIIRNLPHDASWEDLMYQLYVRQKIEAGLANLSKGKGCKHSAIKKEFGLPL